MSKVFVMTNQASGNQVWVYDRSGSGKLTPPTEEFMFSTGGDGTGQPASTADPLGSQGSLAMTADHQLIFAANAGSNDVTCFEVAADGMLTLTDKVGSGGVRPLSVAVSGELVYVLNAGDAPAGGVQTTGGSIAGLRLGAAGQLRPIPGSTRPTGRGASEIKFTPDGNHLVVINKSASTIDTYPVNGDGTLGGIRTTLSATAAPFGGSFLGRDNVGRDVLAVCGLDNRLALYGIGAAGVAEPIGVPMPITGAAGACWTAVDTPGLPGFFYVSSAGSSTIDSFTVNRPAGAAPSLTQSADGPAAMLTPLGDDGMLPPDFLGATDMAVSSDSQFLYVVAGTEVDVPADPNAPRIRAWEIRGYRMNGTKLEEITRVPAVSPPPPGSPPIGTQGIVAS